MRDWYNLQCWISDQFRWWSRGNKRTAETLPNNPQKRMDYYKSGAIIRLFTTSTVVILKFTVCWISDLRWNLSRVLLVTQGLWSHEAAMSAHYRIWKARSPLRERAFLSEQTIPVRVTFSGRGHSNQNLAWWQFTRPANLFWVHPSLFTPADSFTK